MMDKPGAIRTCLDHIGCRWTVLIQVTRPSCQEGRQTNYAGHALEYCKNGDWKESSHPADDLVNPFLEIIPS